MSNVTCSLFPGGRTENMHEMKIENIHIRQLQQQQTQRKTTSTPTKIINYNVTANGLIH